MSSAFTTRVISRKRLPFIVLLIFPFLLELILSATRLKNEWNYFSPVVSWTYSDDLTVNYGNMQLGKQKDAVTASVGGVKVIESYVISIDLDRLDRFYWRNNHTGLQPIWVPGADGFHQPTLNLWSRLMHSELPPLNASHFIPGLPEHKGRYASPHAVGCYLAHWHLLRMLYRRPESLKPDLYLVFEDDTACMGQIAPRLLDVAQKLPPDWDMLYISGKPFVYFQEDEEPFNNTWSDDLVEQKVCAGRFGVGEGITNPNGSRHLRHSDDYWRIDYITNTPSYVVNPHRMDRIMKVLEPKVYEPIDIRLADAMKAGKLNVYMTTQQLCSTTAAANEIIEEPIPWKGFWVFLHKGGGRTHHYRTTDIHVVSPNCSI